MLSESLIITIVLSATGLLGYAFKLCFVSKCDLIKCGCLSIHRRTDEEMQNAPEIAQTQSLPQHIP